MENSKVDWTIFFFSIVTILAVCIPLILFPEAGERAVSAAYSYITAQFGFAYLWAGMACLAFVLWLAWSPYGRVKMGHEAPRFSGYSWTAMMFCAGVATGIIYWGTIEWVYYYEAPPYGMEARSPEAIEWAATYGMFHWGLTGWAFYALPAVAIGYAYHVRKIPRMRVSAACQALLGRHAEGPLGAVMDVLFMVGLLGSAGTSLGLGPPMIAAGASAIFGIEESFGLTVSIVLLCAGLFSVSVWLGLEKGIKRLSNLNMTLALGLLLFVLLAGPTLFIMKMSTNSVGFMFQNFFRMSSWTDPLTDSRFVEDWTIFYWAWWVAVGPFMGIFIAEISRGRTIRQVVLGTLIYGSAGCAVFYGILGNYALHLELNGLVPVTANVAELGAPAAIINVVESLPASGLVLPLFCLISLVFLATTFDSTSYALATCATVELGERQGPAKWHRMFWAFALALVPLTLMYLGQLVEGLNALETLKTAALVVSLPLLLVFTAMSWSLVRSLREDQPRSAPKA